jgi:hypothetical protein
MENFKGEGKLEPKSFQNCLRQYSDHYFNMKDRYFKRISTDYCIKVSKVSALYQIPYLFCACNTHAHINT